MLLLTLYITVIAYLLGSIPFGYIVGRLKGVDVRQHGSGNIGATNVLRVLGKPWGIAVFAADAAKGFAAVRLAMWLSSRTPGAEPYVDAVAIVAAAVCVAGHSFPLWLGFRGGKGVATSAGALFGIIPLAVTAIFFLWWAVFWSTRYVAVASIAAAVALPIAVAVMLWLKMTQGVVLLYFSIVMAALVVWRHRSNIARLRAGTEHRFTRK
jgi:acyl phosphate:glycerol-3-phosphate acyltransferase